TVGVFVYDAMTFAVNVARAARVAAMASSKVRGVLVGGSALGVAVLDCAVVGCTAMAVVAAAELGAPVGAVCRPFNSNGNIPIRAAMITAIAPIRATIYCAWLGGGGVAAFFARRAMMISLPGKPQ